ncbi:MAG: Rieske (2Fe-2S) protein [Pseudonocardia sp.]|nr:Rieske (2Fe-2S) protein [Pseudonocardia sp.]
MSARDVRWFVEDLLHGRRTRGFRPDDDEAAEMRTAIELRAGRAGSGAASEEFVADLRRRLAKELDEPGDVVPLRSGRRRVLQFGSVAAAAVAVGAVADRVAMSASRPAEVAEGPLVPNHGEWARVAASTEVPDGAVRGFEVDGVAGFVRRDDGQVAAVSAVCTHQGCTLRLDAPARELRCPCHATAFAVDGALVRHQLPTPPPALPVLSVRESDGAIEVLAPPPTGR